MTLAITWLITKPQQLAQMSRAIIVAGMLIGLVALNNAANGIDLVEGTRVSIGRSIGSVLGDPNDLALVLMFPLAFTVSQLMEKTLADPITTLRAYHLLYPVFRSDTNTKPWRFIGVALRVCLLRL